MIDIEEFLKPKRHEINAESFDLEVQKLAEKYRLLEVVTANATQIAFSELDSQYQKYINEKDHVTARIFEKKSHELDIESSNKSSIFVSIIGPTFSAISAFEDRVKSLAKDLNGVESQRQALDCRDRFPEMKQFMVALTYDFR